MNSQLDLNLAIIYQNMIGLNEILNDSNGNSNLLESASINSNLFISNQSFLNNSTSLNSKLLISGTNILNTSNINNFINISGFTYFNNNCSINSNLNLNNNFNINKLNISGFNNIIGLANNNQLNISGITTFNNYINVNNISSYSSILNLNATNIILGTTNTNIFINGTATYFDSIQSLMLDKLISLNSNSILKGIDNGSLCGIEIMGISSSGFIMTNLDASRYQIKSPLYGASINYITVQDLNYNLIISGSSILYKSVTTLSNLNISNISVLNNLTSINSSLNIYGNLNICNSLYVNNSLNISNSTIFNNSCSLNSTLNINGNLNNINTISIGSSLNISGSSIINSNLILNNSMNINAPTLINNFITINNILNISSYSITNSLICNNNLNVSNFSNILGNHTINSNIYVSGNSLFNNNITLNSSLYIKNSALINNSVTINSNFGVFGQIILQLSNFNYNTDAKNAGIPVWGFYRTGGTLKIRLNDTPPIIYFSGSTTLSINQSSSFLDPGVFSLDFQNFSNQVYLTGISNSSFSILSNILITGTTTLITLSSLLLIGSYTATYTATDSCGNQAFNYRLLNIITPTYSTAYNFNNGWLGKENFNFTSYINNNNFTIEAWIYPTSFGSNTAGTTGYVMGIIDFRDPSSSRWDSLSGTSGWLGPLQNNDGNTGKCVFGIGQQGLYVWCNTNTCYFMTNNTVILNTWNHVVWMRYNNYLYGFINGYNDNGGITVASAGGSALNNLTNLQTIMIGHDASQTKAHGNWQFYGYISQVLIRSGSQYSINSFTPTLDLSTLQTSNNLFFLNNNYTDTTNNYVLPIRWSVPNVNRYYNYIQSFDSTLGYIGPINAPSNTNWTTIFTNDFTFETWLYPTQYNSQVQSVILDTRNPGGSGNWTNVLNFSMCQNGTIGFTWWYSGGGSARNTYSISTDPVLLNQWSHVVWMRKNNILYVYINGQSYPGFNLTSNNIVFNNLQYICFCHAVDRSTSDYAYSFQGQISQPLFTNYAKYNISFTSSIDLTPSNNDPTVIFFMGNNLVTTSTVVNPNLPTVQTLTRYGSVYNTLRSSLGKWITSYNGSNTILYGNYNLSSFMTTTSWTFEGWIYLNTISNGNLPVIATFGVGNSLNYTRIGTIAFGYNNSQIWIYNGTSDQFYYSNNGLLNNKWNHLAYVMNNSIITFYINGINLGNTSSFSFGNINYLIINGGANQLTNTTRYINGYYSQIALMTVAKYINEFIPYPDLTPTSYTNYLSFLGLNATDLVSNNQFSVYNNYSYITQQVIIPN